MKKKIYIVLGAILFALPMFGQGDLPTTRPLKIGEKNNLGKFNELTKFKMQAQLLNPAGAALVRHINWWRALFFRSLNLASQKDGTFDILSTCTKYCTPGE